MKVHIITYGCALNRADSSLMKSLLVSRGHEVVDTLEEADVVVVNTCTVRLDTELRILKHLRELRKKVNGRKLIIAGCMVAAQPFTLREVVPEASFISPQNIERIVEVVESSERLYLVRGSRNTNYLGIYFEGPVATVPIAEGCIGDCSFCIVKIARRRLASYKPGLIVRVVKEAVRKGAREVDLTAQDTASYGLDLGGVRLDSLLKRVLDEVGGDYFIRIGMANPDTLQPILDGVIEVMRDPRVFKYLHIPLQSADDRVLKLMKRRYTYDEYREIVKEVRRKIPEVTIATDIIVGHPGEDVEAFERTVEAVRELLFDKVHIAQYTIRPRTEAASMKQVPDPIKKARSTRLAKVVEEVGYEINRQYVGSVSSVVLTHRTFRGNLAGRTSNYKLVIVRSSGVKLGEKIVVRVTGNSFFDLRGELL